MMQKIIHVLLGYIQNKYTSYNYIMKTYPKFLVNIDSYIDVLTMYVPLKTQFWKIKSSCKLNLKLKNSIDFVAR